MIYHTGKITWRDREFDLVGIDYIWVSSEHRSQSLGQLLLNHLKTSEGEDRRDLITVAEVEAPSARKEAINNNQQKADVCPERRLLFWKREGFEKQVSGHWIPADLIDNQEFTTRLPLQLILKLPNVLNNERVIPTETYLAIWESFYPSGSVDNGNRDRALNVMQTQIHKSPLSIEDLI